MNSTQEQDLSNCSVQNIGNKLLSGACYSLQYPLDMKSGSDLIGFIIFKCFGILSSFWFCLPKVMKILTYFPFFLGISDIVNFKVLPNELVFTQCQDTTCVVQTRKKLKRNTHVAFVICS